jgi:formylmethanofuran dehydrogenase subunit D
MYTENVAVCEIDPEDLETLKISSGTNVLVKTKTGEVVVKGLVSSQAPHRGIAFMPLGPWANVLIGSESNGTGMPSYKGIVAEIRPAPEDVILEAEQLVEAIYRGK